MNCIIVDDDKMAQLTLRQLIDQTDQLDLTATCSGAAEAIAFLKKNDVDLVFLDIEMPEMSGIELLRNFKIEPMIILTTSHKEYALDAFEFNVIDYLVKPFTLERFLKAAGKAKDLFENSKNNIESFGPDHFFIKKNASLNRVLLKDIFYVEALGDYVNIYTSSTKYTLHLTLRALESKLPADKFIRIHRSFIANFDNITSIEDTMAVIDKKLIPIGALYRENFLKRLNYL